ncbi:MAG: biotin carboxylase, partial [Luminiphilus sp.]|nr:biotin carboxylase [Luminiphilus sp.]
MSYEPDNPLANLQDRLANTEDTARPDAVTKRHNLGGRTARENLADLTGDAPVFEYGQLAVAAQRQRREGDALFAETAADAVITAVGSVNSTLFPESVTRTALIINDYTVLA